MLYDLTPADVGPAGVRGKKYKSTSEKPWPSTMSSRFLFDQNGWAAEQRQKRDQNVGQISGHVKKAQVM